MFTMPSGRIVHIGGFAGSDESSLDSTGKKMAFMSLAALVPADGNNLHDIYLRTCGPTATSPTARSPT